MKWNIAAVVLLVVCSMTAGLGGNELLVPFTALVLVVPLLMAGRRSSTPQVFAAVLLIAVALAPGAAAMAPPQPANMLARFSLFEFCTWGSDDDCGDGDNAGTAKSWGLSFGALGVGCGAGAAIGVWAGGIGAIPGCLAGALSAAGGTAVVDVGMNCLAEITPGGRGCEDAGVVKFGTSVIDAASGQGTWARVGQTAPGIWSPSAVEAGDRMRNGEGGLRPSDFLWAATDGIPGGPGGLLGKGIKGANAGADGLRILGHSDDVTRSLKGTGLSDDAAKFAAGFSDDVVRDTVQHTARSGKFTSTTADSLRYARGKLPAGYTSAAGRTVGAEKGLAKVIKGSPKTRFVANLPRSLVDDAAKGLGRIPKVGRLSENVARTAFTMSRGRAYLKTGAEALNNLPPGTPDSGTTPPPPCDPGDTDCSDDPAEECVIDGMQSDKRWCSTAGIAYLECVTAALEQGFDWAASCKHLEPSWVCEAQLGDVDICKDAPVIPTPPEPDPNTKYKLCRETLGLPESYCRDWATDEGGALKRLLDWFINNVKPVISFDGEPTRFQEDGESVFEVEVEVNHGKWGIDCDGNSLNAMAKALNYCLNEYELAGIQVLHSVDGVIQEPIQLERDELLADDILDEASEEAQFALYVGVPFQEESAIIKVHVTALYQLRALQEDGSYRYIPAEGATPQYFVEPDQKEYTVEPCSSEEACKDDKSPGNPGDVEPSDGTECGTAGNCIEDANDALGGLGLQHLGKYWWIGIILVAGGIYVIGIWRSGQLYVWSNQKFGRKPGPKFYQKPSIFARLKSSVTGKEPEKKLKPAYRLEVPLNAPAKPDGSGPDLEAFKRQLNEEGAKK